MNKKTIFGIIILILLLINNVYAFNNNDFFNQTKCTNINTYEPNTYTFTNTHGLKQSRPIEYVPKNTLIIPFDIIDLKICNGKYLFTVEVNN